MALGAQRSERHPAHRAQGIGLALVGAEVGLVVSLALARFNGRALYGVEPNDP